MRRSLHVATAVLAGMLAGGGCALKPPEYDVSIDVRGVPITRSITDRIKCELVALVRPDVDPIFEHQRKLLQEDYQVAMQLVLDVTDKGGLTPSLLFLETAKFAFNINAKLDQSREDSLTINLLYSMRDLYAQVSRDPNRFDCPAIVDTNLAGDLGLRRNISAALEADGLTTSSKVSASDGEFSGTINFISTKAITSAGPTWTFTHFVGPKDFASLSRVNNDKLLFGFAAGPNAGKPLTAPLSSLNQQSRAVAALERQIGIDFGIQLSGIRNSLRGN